MASKSDSSAAPRRGIEQILATTDGTTLVIKATNDGKLHVTSNSFVGRDFYRSTGGWA
jgi:hypothetical protein